MDLDTRVPRVDRNARPGRAAPQTIAVYAVVLLGVVQLASSNPVLAQDGAAAIEEGNTVTINYTLSLDNDTTVGSTEEGEPVTDFNHPLAGEALTFDVTILTIE